MKRTPLWVFVVLPGAAAGLLSALSPGGCFLLLAAAATAAALHRFSPRPEKGFLVALFLSGFLLRALCSSSLDLAAWRIRQESPFLLKPTGAGETHAVDRSRRPFRMQDSDDYSERGYAIARYAEGSRDPVLRAYLNNRYGNNAYLYVVGGFYYLFGFSPVSVKWINALLGALLGPLTFFLAMECFRNRWAARSAALLTAFFPSLFLWSLSNMKEPLLFFSSLLVLWGLSRLWSTPSRRGRLLLGAACALLLLLHAALRFPVYTAALLCAWLAVAALTARRRPAWKLLLLLAVAAGLWGTRAPVRKALVNGFYCHARYISAQGTGYRILPDFYYTEEGRAGLSRGEMELTPARFLYWSAKALHHYAAEPLPRRMGSAPGLAVYPQMVFWYFALAFAAAAVFRGVAASPPGLFLLLVLASWLGIGALTNGNVGTVFRFRDMVTPLVLILACLGARIFLKGKEEPAQ